VELLEAARLGEPVRLIVVREFSGKGFRLNRNSDGEGELNYACTVKVLDVEAGEAAYGPTKGNKPCPVGVGENRSSALAGTFLSRGAEIRTRDL
jgi:hypothetical protein